MLEVLRQRVPEVSAKVATAEEIPANDRSVDVVVVAQAFHWFDHEAALPEIARVLKPGGHVALVWNSRDERIPWVRRMGDLLGRQDLDTSSAEQLVHSDLFGFMEEASFKHWQEVNRETILDMARSRSSFAMGRGPAGAPPGRRARLLRRLRPWHGRDADPLRDALLPRRRGRPRRAAAPPSTARSPTARS